MNFHHIGLACLDLNHEAEKLAALGYSAEGADFADPIQGVRGRFLTGGGPRLELLSPASESGVLTPWLKSGAKMYHLAYEVDDLPQSIAKLRQQRAKVVVQPVPAVAFGGRHIAFLMLPNMLLCELIESPR